MLLISLLLRQSQKHGRDGGYYQSPGHVRDRHICLQMTALVVRSSARRAVSSTDCNAVSLRSHSVLNLQMLPGPGDTLRGTFVMIDLVFQDEVTKSGVANKA